VCEGRGWGEGARRRKQRLTGRRSGPVSPADGEVELSRDQLAYHLLYVTPETLMTNKALLHKLDMLHSRGLFDRCVPDDMPSCVNDTLMIPL